MSSPSKSPKTLKRPAASDSEDASENKKKAKTSSSKGSGKKAPLLTIEKKATGDEKPKKEDIPKADPDNWTKPTDAELVDYICMKGADLAKIVKEKGLPVTGTLPQMLSRLVLGKKLKEKADEEAVALALGGNNEYLANAFKILSEGKEGFELNALNKVISILKYLPYKLTTGKEAEKLKGIGKSSAAKITILLEEEAAGGAGADGGFANRKKTAENEKILENYEKQGQAEHGSLRAAVQAVMRSIQSEEGATQAEINKLVCAKNFDSADVDKEVTQMIEEGLLFNTVDEERWMMA